MFRSAILLRVIWKVVQIFKGILCIKLCLLQLVFGYNIAYSVVLLNFVENLKNFSRNHIWHWKSVLIYTMVKKRQQDLDVGHLTKKSNQTITTLQDRKKVRIRIFRNSLLFSFYGSQKKPAFSVFVIYLLIEHAVGVV